MNKLPSFLDDPMVMRRFPSFFRMQEEFGWKLVHGDIFKSSKERDAAIRLSRIKGHRF